MLLEVGDSNLVSAAIVTKIYIICIYVSAPSFFRKSEMLRRNNNTSMDRTSSENTEGNESFASSSLMLDIGDSNSLSLSASTLLSCSPKKYGYLHKKNNSLLAKAFPCLFEQWKRRFFILIGNFLFRFSSEESKAPKGAPIPLDAIRVSLLDSCLIEIVMIRKVYIIKADSRKQASDWIEAINERKFIAVKEAMGHKSQDSKVRDINRDAAKIFQKKLNSESVQQSQAVSNPLHSYVY